MFSPDQVHFGDLQSMEMLMHHMSGAAAAGATGESVGGASGMEGVTTPDFAAEPADAQMDLGLGLGWEGWNRDFSEGHQQVDLFGGFFFGGGAGQGQGQQGDGNGVG